MVAMFKPIAPLANYVINKDFIAEVLCVNQDKPEMQCEGKCHLKKELKKATNSEKEKGIPTAAKIKVEDYPIGFIQFTSLESFTKSSNLSLLLNTGFILAGFANNLFQPPEL